ncbi:cation:proton antiporter [Spirillospora sp. CA-108201]
MTTDEILFGFGLTVALAVGSQLLAGRLRIPALIVLLPTGFVAGALTSDIDPHRLLGAAFEPLVSLSVALILYEAGFGLDLRKLKGDTRRIVARLIVVGVPLTMAAAALLAAVLLDLSTGAAVMLGAILVVSGPTVVSPLLGFVRPAERVQRILLWEGSLIDPIGGILGAVVFSGVVQKTRTGSGVHALQFGLSIGAGLAGGVIGTGLLWLLMRRLRFGDVLANTGQLAIVVVVAAACDIARDDAGLLAAIIMGLAVANLKGFDLPADRPVSETLVQLIIGVLFISISATITPSSLADVALPALGLITALVLLVRPLLAYLSTFGTGLTTGERCFIGWMDPRGIVAAATASTFSVELAAQGIGGASKILPVTFLVIVATVTLYGLTATPVARRLHVVRAADQSDQPPGPGP